jgi:hypothetical protein
MRGETVAETTEKNQVKYAIVSSIQGLSSHPQPNTQPPPPPTHNNLTSKGREGHWKVWALKLMYSTVYQTHNIRYRIQNTEHRTLKLM